MRASYPFPLWNLAGSRSDEPDAWTEVFDWRYRLLAYYAGARGLAPDRLDEEDRLDFREWLRIVRDEASVFPAHPWSTRRREMRSLASTAAGSCLAGGPADADFRGDCVVWGLMEHAKEGIEAPDTRAWIHNALGWDADLTDRAMAWMTRNRQVRRVEKRLRALKPELWSAG